MTDRALGGGPERDVLPYGRPWLDDEDRRAVLDVLSGDWLTQGPLGERFETALCDYTGSKHAITCSNGTTALHLAALALGWGPGDVILVPAITFLATANCCAYVGAEPHFVDIDDQTLCIDPNEVERHVIALREAGRRVRGIIGVDMAGHPCDWPALRALADRYDLDLVDDASHALGAQYANGTPIGSGAHADFTTLSFHPVKHITTGEGGAVLLNDAGRAAVLARLRTHGVVRGQEAIEGWEGPWHYDMVELGFNYRLTDIQCALGLSQLRKIERFITRRRMIARAYSELLADFEGVRLPAEAVGVRHAYHLYPLRVNFEQLGLTRRELFARCRNSGIALQVHYRPLVSNSYYRELAERQGAQRHLPVSANYYRETVSIPMYPQIGDLDVERVVSTLRHTLVAATDGLRHVTAQVDDV